MYKDNRDLPTVDLCKKAKYHPHVKATVDEFCRHVSPPARVVDVGSRDGYAVELLNDLGYKAVGWELVLDYVVYAKENGRAVIEADILKAPARFHQSIDAIFSRHCIEHVRQPLDFLIRCAYLVRTGGIVFLTFPLETTDEWKARDKKDHLCHFPHKQDFLNIVQEVPELVPKYCGRSKHLGIQTVGK